VFIPNSVILSHVRRFGLAGTVYDAERITSGVMEDVLLDSLMLEVRLPVVYFVWCFFGTIFVKIAMHVG